MKKSNKQKSTPKKSAIVSTEKIDTSKKSYVTDAKNLVQNSVYNFLNTFCTKPHTTRMIFVKSFMHPTLQKSFLMFECKNNIFYIQSSEMKSLNITDSSKKQKPVFLKKHDLKHLSKNPIDQILIVQEIIEIADAI